MKTRPVHLIGPRDAYRRHCHGHGLGIDSPGVVHVTTLEELKNVHDGQIIFLVGWEFLEEGQAMYNYVIGRRSAERNAREYGDIAPGEPLGARLPGEEPDGGA